MATMKEVQVTVTANTVEFEISLCLASLEVARAHLQFWESKLADAIAKRG